MSGYPSGVLPTLDSGGRLADQFSHLADAAELGEEGVCFHDGKVYDSVAHFATSNSHRHDAIFSQHRRVAHINEKLKQLREQAVPKLSVRKMAEEMDIPASTYAAYEDPAKFKKPILPMDKAKKIAVILEKRGVNPAEVMRLAGVTGELSAILAPVEDTGEDEDWLKVGASVAAGVWREPSEHADVMEIHTPPVIRGHRRFGMTVEGYSMDIFYEPGTVLDCISIYKTGVKPATGDHVIVERRRPDGLRECTVKEFVERNGSFFVRPRSTKPDFQDEIEVGRPDENHLDDGEEVKVVGYVVSAIPPRVLNLLDRMGKVRRNRIW